MKVKLTSRDFLLLLGIAVATLIVVTSIFYREALITVNPSATKKSKMTQAAVMLNKSILVVSKILDAK